MRLSNDDSHGGDVYALARGMGGGPDMLLDFSSNANLFALPLTRKLTEETPYPFEHYPDSGAAELVDAIARFERIEPERVLPGNGASELIWLAVQALAPRKALCIGPIFSEFVKAFRVFGIPYEVLTPPVDNKFTCTTEDLGKVWNTDADLVVLCTPNNPAGVTYDNILGLLDMLRAPRVIIDNSYKEFLHGTPDYEINSLHSYQRHLRPGVNLFTLHSFTKFFCCPGIRLGYLLGDRVQLGRMLRLRPSWTISTYAQNMGKIFLDSVEEYRETLSPLREAVKTLGSGLRGLSCMQAERIFEGPGFLCCGLAQGRNAKKIYDSLLKQHMVIRNCDTIPGMPQGFIRVRARTGEENGRLLSALARL